MDPSLIITGGITLLKPLLEKAGEKAAETIGEKVAEGAATKSFWKNVKRVFVIDDEEEVINEIEKKTIASSDDVKKIENKLIAHTASNPQFASELEASFQLSSTDKFQAELILKSILKDKEKLEELYEDKRLASVDAVGGYELMIAKTVRRMAKDERDFFKLVKMK